jgi:hypothetical protein
MKMVANPSKKEKSR